MTAQIAAYGRLGRDPRQHETKSGKPMASASLAVTVEARERGADDPEGTLWLPDQGLPGELRRWDGKPGTVSARVPNAAPDEDGQWPLPVPTGSSHGQSK